MALQKRDPIEAKLKAAELAGRETKITELAAATPMPAHRVIEPGEGTTTVTVAAYTPPERIPTEQLNVRIPKPLHDRVKAKHRATGEPIKNITTRALEALLNAEEGA